MKRVGILILLLLLATSLLPSAPAASAASNPSYAASQRVLLLYDSLGKGTDKEGNVAGLQRLLAAYSTQVTLKNISAYKQGDMSAYSGIITVVNHAGPPIEDRAYLEDVAGFQGSVLHVGYQLPSRIMQAMQVKTAVWHGPGAGLSVGGFSAIPLRMDEMPYITAEQAERSYGEWAMGAGGVQAPYAVSSGRFAYVPYLKQGDLSGIAMAYVLKDWLHSPIRPRTYLVLKEIYPFSDLDLLEKTADELYERGIPFIASIRPVFGNTDFPAMKRYLDALRTVQSHNGSIVINAPAVRPPIKSDDRSLRGKMSSFIDVLAEGGVAPLGIAAENYWTYDKEYSTAGMGFFDSAVLYGDEEARYMEQTDTSMAFPSVLYSLKPELLQGISRSGKAMPELPLNAALTYDLPEDEEALKEMLQELDAEWYTFADYKQAPHEVTTETSHILSADGVITVGAAALNVDYIPQAVAGDYEYQEEQATSFNRLFSVQNQFFIIVILIALLLFGGLLTVGYRLYRRKYLK
ncbi:hypothetical protein [Paenibacillus sp. MMS20-IR301]|uniref:hypothetical protein n=1 Tax=Paenibacillus sp. MMS20-IR301 TaxID=2895946 RepID=UPI0028E19163|nr:hypothetical protein [Paenibacillus sp. MMS20-IR301]WNS42449.1 hypothetical protein LOS79_26230 [Paenibacillus sp. MMS20-IR301]